MIRRFSQKGEALYSPAMKGSVISYEGHKEAAYLQ